MTQRELEFSSLSPYSGTELKERGMSLAAENRKANLRSARKLAAQLARERAGNCITADVVASEWDRLGGDWSRDIGNAAGSLFKGKDWEFTGVWATSTRGSRHAGMIRVWKYNNELDSAAERSDLL